jgi:Ca2+-binding EF-hand superfamily protein
MGEKASKVKAPENQVHHVNRRHSSLKSHDQESDLTEADYNFLEHETGLSRHEISRIHSKFIKEASNGELGHDEFLDFYYSLTAEPPAFLQENSQFIFDSFDKDHNGKVSFREFLNAYVLTSPGNLQRKIEYTFELYDMDNNGYLDIEEIYRIAVRLFELLDQNKKTDMDALKFAEDVVRQLDVSPRDGKITKGKSIWNFLFFYSLRVCYIKIYYFF